MGSSRPFRYRFKSKSKCIAYIDFVLKTMTLLYPCLHLLFVMTSPFLSDDLDAEDAAWEALGFNNKFLNPNDDDWRGMVLVLSYLAIKIFAVSYLIPVPFVAAYRLIRSTELVKNVIVAAEWAGFWRKMTIFYTVFLILEGPILGVITRPLCFASIVFNFIGIYSVNKFILELELAAWDSGIRPSHRQTILFPAPQELQPHSPSAPPGSGTQDLTPQKRPSRSSTKT